MMMTTLSTATLARSASARATARSSSRATVRAAATSNNNKSVAANDNKKQQMPTLKQAGTVLGGVAAAGLAQALAPSPAMAISITDPVFGDIQVWQFIVLTAGYWLGIEYYLDNKYDDDKKKGGDIMPKVSEAKKSAFAEANSAKEAENTTAEK